MITNGEELPQFKGILIPVVVANSSNIETFETTQYTGTLFKCHKERNHSETICLFVALLVEWYYLIRK